MPKEELWILEQIKASVRDGVAYLDIAVPEISSPKDKAIKVANPSWLREQLGILTDATRMGVTLDRSIPLTRMGWSLLRMGGGFLQVQGNNIVVIKRDLEAPFRPGVFCEAGGLFEAPDKDLIKRLLLETNEILRVEVNSNFRLWIPQFEEPDPLSIYNEAIRTEHARTAQKLNLHTDCTRSCNAVIIEPKDCVWVKFGNAPVIPMLMIPEFDTSSLELIGIIKCDDISVTNYYDGEHFEKNCQTVVLDREIHVINFLNGSDAVWQSGKVRHSAIEEEVRAIDRSKTKGLVATEKLQAAIRGLPFEAPGLVPLLDQKQS